MVQYYDEMPQNEDALTIYTLSEEEKVARAKEYKKIVEKCNNFFSIKADEYDSEKKHAVNEQVLTISDQGCYTGCTVYDSSSYNEVYAITPEALRRQRIRLTTRPKMDLSLNEVALNFKTNRFTLVFSDTPNQCQFYEIDKKDQPCW